MNVPFPEGFSAEDAGESDLPALVELIGEFLQEQEGLEPAFAPAAGWRHSVPGWLAGYIQHPESFVRLARKGPEPAGFALFSIQEEPMLRAARQGVLLDLYVRPAFRRRGLGTALARSALWTLRHRQVDLVRLDVLAANEPALRFWESLGFQVYQLRLQASGRNPDLAPRPARKVW